MVIYFCYCTYVPAPRFFETSLSFSEIIIIIIYFLFVLFKLKFKNNRVEFRNCDQK